ncbi:glycosyltransferase family 4 protein [Parapusillimonas sp. SGNA-6]|nr:glycosyltransferase family 4 protein [Parapusillimonas sp. SGNA-6]
MDALSAPSSDPLRILTWHVHGNYLYALTQVPHEFIIPVRSDGRPGYTPLGHKIPWGPNVRQILAEDIAREAFDCVIYQSRTAYEDDAPVLLSDAQRALPSLYIEHDPPRPFPVDTAHWFKHDNGILVHVTHYNALNWDAGSMPTRVIEHGVPIAADVVYGGERERGITVINGLVKRGRRMGADLFEWTRRRVPLDLIGMESEAMGGLGEVANMSVAATVARYRFFYTPIRYTSLGLALIEAMLAGVPVVGVAATELPTVIVNEHNGFVHTDKELLVDVMRTLIDDPGLARRWGAAGQATARKRFGMARFIADWQDVIAEVTATRPASARV